MKFQLGLLDFFVTIFMFCPIVLTNGFFISQFAHFKYQIKSQNLKPLRLIKNDKTTSTFTSNVPQDIELPNIWGTRRKLIRYFLKDEAKKRVLTPEVQSTANATETSDETINLSAKVTIGISAFFIAIGATIFRFGGRAAFIQFLGLDFVTNQDLKGQIDSFITSFDSMGDIRYVAFLCCWIVAKFVCIDFLTLVLALSSGVIFGGNVLKGAIVSVICSTLASLPPFFISRYTLRDRAREEISKRPTWRAIDRVIARDGLKAVFVLRLSPLLPIPIGAYNYLYGAMPVSVLDFVVGLSAASIKPYFLDSYLGVYGKSIMDGDTNQNDLLFASVLFILVLVGSFSTQLAESTYAEIKKETELDKLNKNNNNGVTNTTTNTNTVNENGEIDFMGIQMKIPDIIQNFSTGLTHAGKRIDFVIADEWKAIKNEILVGIFEDMDQSIDWDGKRVSTVTVNEATVKFQNNLIDSNSISHSNNSHDIASVNLIHSIQENINNNEKNIIYTNTNTNTNTKYPGTRSLQSYESRRLDESTLSEYTYESLLFGFCVINSMIKLIFLKEELE